MAEMADATVTVAPNTDQTPNTQQPTHVQLPDDHPLVKTLDKLRGEIAELKKTPKAPEAPAAELTAAQAELAKAKLALKYKLSETDAAMPDGGEAGEALAKRLSADNNASGGLPVIQDLGNKTSLKTDDIEEAAAKFFGQLLKP